MSGAEKQTQILENCDFQMSISIREMSRDDTVEALKLIHKVFPNSNVSISYNDVVLFAEKNSRQLGFIHFTETKDKVLLKGIGVEDNRRGAGIGTRLMRAAIKLFANRDKSVYLKTQAENPVVNLYASYGFMLKRFGDIYTLVKRPYN